MTPMEPMDPTMRVRVQSNCSRTCKPRLRDDFPCYMGWAGRLRSNALHSS